MQVEVTGATLKFRDEPIFSNLSASFPSGKVTALVGPSGSGKSSLLAAISGYIKLNEGSIGFHFSDGRICTKPTPSLVAWVPQGSNALGRRSVMDNVMIAPLSAGKDIQDSMKAALSALKQVGLTSRLASQARSLSGGELQRLAFARALASDKPLILADEPSANLDVRNTEIIARILNNLSSRACIVVATHDPLLIAAAQKVVQMRWFETDG